MFDRCKSCACYGLYPTGPCAACLKSDSFVGYMERQSDPVNSPAHYQNGGIETIEIIRAMLTPDEFRGYCKGNVIKYRERAQFKGSAEQDYAKAKWYMDRLKETP